MLRRDPPTLVDVAPTLLRSIRLVDDVAVLALAVLAYFAAVVTLRDGGEAVIWTAAVLIALGVIYRYVVRPIRMAIRWLTTMAARVEEAVHGYPQMREMVAQIVDRELPLIERRLHGIETGTNKTVEAVEAIADTPPVTPPFGTPTIKE